MMHWNHLTFAGRLYHLGATRESHFLNRDKESQKFPILEHQVQMVSGRGGDPVCRASNPLGLSLFPNSLLSDIC